MPGSLAFIENLVQLFISDASVLHRVGSIFVAELPLDCRNVPRLLNQVTPHRVPCTMRRAAIDAGELRHIIPYVIDHPFRQSAASLPDRAGSEKKRRCSPFLVVLIPFVLAVIANRVQALFADLIAMEHRALLPHRSRLPARIDVIDIEPGDGGPAHPGFNQSVDDGAVPIRSIAFALRPLPLSTITVSILRLAADPQE